MWKEVIPIMQNWTGCADLGMEETITMKDDRDYSDNLYTVAKLKDGKCWMTQNLRIGKDVTMQLSSSDSDIDGAYTLPAVVSGDGFGKTNNPIVCKNYDYGLQYNWVAATAGDYNPNKQVYDVQHSICPKNFHLPTANEFYHLFNSYLDKTQLLSMPANIQLAGIYCEANNGQGAHVYFQSSTATATVYFTKSGQFGATTSSSNSNSLEASIRCMTQ